MWWPLGRQYELPLDNKLPLYKCLQASVSLWVYRVQPLSCTKTTTLKLFIVSKINRFALMLTYTGYVRNNDIHRDLKMLMFTNQ